MPTAAHQFGVRDLMWFLFGTGAFLSAWSAHNPLGWLMSAGLLAIFYWSVNARDVLVLHCLYAGFGLIAGAIVLITSAFGLDWPEATACVWWSARASCLAATLVSYAAYLLSLLARQL